MAAPPPPRPRPVWAEWQVTVLITHRYFESVFNASGLQALVAQYGDWFSYDGSPRAQIFRRNQSLVHDLDSMLRLMRCVGELEP